jgi:hypothetical protein
MQTKSLFLIALCLVQTSVRAEKPAQPSVLPSPVRSLKAEPSTIEIRGARSIGRVLVTAQLANGSLRDVTQLAEITPADSKGIKVEAGGVLRPLKEGTYPLNLRWQGKTTRANVVITDLKPSPVSFHKDIIPILTRYGCNQGSCHGAQYGKGGFKLSLAGYDPDLDYNQIARLVRGRRLSLSAPEKSLLLTKPLMQVPHGGGRRLEADNPDYKTLVRWIAEGAPPPLEKDAHVVKLEVTPSERVLAKGDPSQALLVRAFYSDGTSREVTAQARISTLNDGVATVTPQGVVSPVNRGQTAIMVRYGGQAAIATIIVPFARLTPKQMAQPLPPIGVDYWITRKQRQVGLLPSPLCDDTTFLRRVSLDVIGTMPTAEEIRTFLADKTPNKREKWIDALLARPEYADYWTLKWGDLLRSNRTNLGPKGMWSFTNWIRSQLQANRPVDQFVHDLILAQGSTFTQGPSNFYRVASNPQDLAETTSQVFLGVRLQCARCHNHPFEKWTQKDYYQFAAFFARVGLKGSNEFGIFGNEQVVRINDYGDVYHPKTNKRMYPTPLGVQLAALPEDKQPNPDADGDRRAKLAEWLVGKNNRLFARNIVNRYWGYLMGKGIVDPIDDLRITNPPSNPELLDYLADALIKNNFDLKKLIRTITLSEAYQRSSESTPTNRYDTRFASYYIPKRLPAEVLLDAIDHACGTQEKFPSLPQGTRAIQLPDPLVGSEFLDTFGRPARLIACECERMAEPNISQTLRMMNGELVNRKTGQGDGRIAKLVQAKRNDENCIEEIYLTALGRLPTPKEKGIIKGVLTFSKDRKAAFEDVLVTLINSKEFLFNH